MLTFDLIPMDTLNILRKLNFFSKLLPFDLQDKNGLQSLKISNQLISLFVGSFIYFLENLFKKVGSLAGLAK